MSNTDSIPEGLYIPLGGDVRTDGSHPVVPGYAGSDFVAYCDSNLSLLWANGPATDLLKLDGTLPAGRTCHDLFCPETEACPACTARSVLETSRPTSWDKTFADGRVLEITAYPSFAGSDTADGILLIGTDVTENRRASSELRRSNDTVRSLFRAAPVGIGVAVDRVLTHVNEQLQTMTGYSREELIGENVRLLYTSDDEYEAVGDYKYRVLARQGVCTVETRFRTKDGETMDVFMRSAVLDRSNLEAGVIFTILDMTERNRTQEALERALQQKDTLLREVHHRSKNNMQIISSLLNLEAERAGRSEVSQPLQKMRARIRSMALVHEKLYQSDDLERVDLAEYAEKLSSEVVSLHSAGLARTIDAEEIPVDIDFAVPFGLILNELLTNSLQHGFDADSRGTVSITIRRDAEFIRLEIRDDGRGIPQEFDIRQSDSLGLRLVSALVEQLHGSIMARRDGGTVWEILLMDVSYLKTHGAGAE